MRKNFFLIIIPGIVIGIGVFFLVTGISRTRSMAESDLLQPVKSTRASGADKQIKSAQSVIQNKPNEPHGFNMLAAAFMQKARETGDFTLNDHAGKSLEQAFKIDPNNFDSIKLQSALLLNYHRFADALEMTRRAMAINSHNHEVLGAMVDAQVELGDYPDAVETAQKMVDLRPDTASYSRVSYLRSLHGDQKGAIEAMKMAAEAASGSAESAAWCHVHLGDELMNTNKPDEAEHEYDYALYVFPDYYAALAAKARARYAAGDIPNAIDLYKRAIDHVPMPDYIAALGDLYTKQGQTNEAKDQYAQVEFIEKMGTTGGVYSRQLALFWADHDTRLDEALSIAQQERATRGDIFASDILAWCLYKNGRIDEAKTSINEALRLGTHDPRMLYHAGMIAIAAGDNQKGVDYLKLSLELNPFFDVLQAEIAKEKLASLKGK